MLLLALAIAAAQAQTASPTPAPPAPHKPRPKTPQSPYNLNLILLDPAHGGADHGATLGPDSLEKDATVAFADLLKTLLTTRGFTVVLTHDAASDSLTADQRAELANRTHASACLFLHAANGGHGVHLYTSSIPPLASLISSLSNAADEPRAIQPWGSAQAATLPQSLSLAVELSTAVHAIRIPLVTGKASIAPIDSVTCPAVALELAPFGDANRPTPASDPVYQQRIAEAVANALDSWRNHLQAQINGQIAAQAITSGDTSTPNSNKTPTRKPAPKVIPEETPGDLAPTPAPIIRRPPPDPTPPSGGPPQ